MSVERESSREAFLSRVRTAQRQGNAYRVRLRPLPPDTGYVGAGGGDEDLCAAMAREVDEVGGEAAVLDDRRAARTWLSRWLEGDTVRRALCWQHELLDELGLDELLAETRVERIDYSQLADLPVARQREIALGVDVGITSVDWAIAETGTLMVCARPGQERMASLVPPVHVCLVHERQIVPDLIDAVGNLARTHDPLPSNVTLITGPSKTGDVELQLTTGVHGPGVWRVGVVRSH